MLQGDHNILYCQAQANRVCVMGGEHPGLSEKVSLNGVSMMGWDQQAVGVHWLLSGTDCENWPSQLHECRDTIISYDNPCYAQDLETHDDQLIHVSPVW